MDFDGGWQVQRVINYHQSGSAAAVAPWTYSLTRRANLCHAALLMSPRQFPNTPLRTSTFSLFSPLPALLQVYNHFFPETSPHTESVPASRLRVTHILHSTGMLPRVGLLHLAVSASQARLPQPSRLCPFPGTPKTCSRMNALSVSASKQRCELPVASVWPSYYPSVADSRKTSLRPDESN